MIALSLFAAVLGALLLVPLSAAAASIGPGYQQPGKPLNHLGGYLTPGGRVAYCIDAGLPSAVARDTGDSGVVESVSGLTAAEMLRLNTLLVRHGETSDANTAAAVAMAVWSIAGDAAYQAEGGDGYVLVRAPADQRMAIQALADRFRAEAAAITAAPPTAVLSISIDADDDYGGILALDASPGPVTITTNGVFSSEPFAVTDRSVRTVFWVATLTKNDVVVAEGLCGDSAETTVITASEAPLRLPVVSG